MTQEEHNDIEYIPQDSKQSGDLKIINNIRFTDREIDIIACIIAGRAYKKISSFLSISSKTVEMHVRNIMLRLGCNSRDSIIDFIEQSDKFMLIKKHYSTLLIKVAFELELKDLKRLTNNKNINCLIFYYKKGKGKDLFVSELEKHLNISGINTSSKVWVEGKSADFLTSKLALQQVHYVIYVMTDDFVKHIKTSQSVLTDESSNLMTIIKQKSSHIIFLLLNEKVLLESYENMVDFTSIDLKVHKNYFLLFFELLKKMLPDNDLDNNINEFKKQQIAFLRHIHSQEWRKQDTLLHTTSINHPRGLKKISIAATINLLLIIYIGFIIFKPEKYIDITNNNSRTKHEINISEDHTTNNHIIQHSEEQNNKFVTKTQLATDLPQKEGGDSRKAIQRQHTKSGTYKSSDSVNYANIWHKMTLFNLPSRNTKFTGRKVALKQIEEKLCENKFALITQPISGLAGVGKTQLATEFAYQAAEKNIYRIIVWVTAETLTEINDIYREFAEFLQIDIRGLRTHDIRILVHNKLIKKYEDGRILFILDNVANYDVIGEHLEKMHKELANNFSLHILITSRSQYWPDSPLILNAFNKQEAIEFVKKHLREERKNSIYKLVEILQYYPLALSQAAAYIKKHTNIDDYLEMYSIKRQDYLDKFPDNRDQYKETLWKTWHIALDKLGSAAHEILSISAYLYPDDIPITFFDNLDVIQRGNAIEELRKHSFIILTNNNKSFKIHRLLQEVIRLSTEHSKDNNIINFRNKSNKGNLHAFAQAIRLLKNKFNFNYSCCTKWHICSQYLTHALRLAEHAISINSGFLHEGIQLYAQICIYLTHVQQDNKNAIDKWNRLLNLIEKHYANDKSLVLALANINANLGYVMRQTDNIKQAEEHLKKATSIYNSYKTFEVSTNIKKILSYLSEEQNLSTEEIIKCNKCFVLLNSGLIQQQLGNFQVAESCYKKALELLEKCKLAKYTAIYKISILQYLANLYRYCGNIEQAKNILKTIKNIADKEFPNHIEQSHIYERMASLQYYIGEYNIARGNLKKSLKIRLTTHAKEHYRIGNSKSLLGLVLCASNHMNEGISNLKQAEAIYNKNFGKNHFRFMFLYVHMHYAFEMNKEFNKALQYMMSARRIAVAHNYSQRALIHQLSPIESLANLHPSEKQKRYYMQALDLTKQLFGNEHIRVARYHYILGCIYDDIHDQELARYNYQAALNIAAKQHFNDITLTIAHQQNIKTIKARLQKVQG